MQQERHDPVKTVRRIQQFTWTMVKLKVVIDESLDKEGSVMTRYKRLTTLIEQGGTTIINRELKQATFLSTRRQPEVSCVVIDGE